MNYNHPSYHQERMWFIERFEKGKVYPDSPVYHNALLTISIAGDIDVAVLERSIRAVISANEILHTSIGTLHDQPVLKLNQGFQFHLLLKDADEHLKNEQAAAEHALDYSLEPIDLNSSLLVKAALYRYSSRQALLAIIAHHAIADSRSLHLAGEQVLAYYAAFSQATAPPQYTQKLNYNHFTAWQKNLGEETLDDLLFYWRKQLNYGRLETLQQPTDLNRHPFHVYEAGQVNVEFKPGTLEKIRDVCADMSVDVQTFLLSVLNILLFKYSGQKEISVGFPVDHRQKLGLDNILGPVSNLTVLKTVVDPAIPVGQFIKSCSGLLINADRYGDMPFDKLVLDLAPEKDMSRTALFDVLFQYETEALPVEKAGLQARFHSTNQGWGKYDLNALFIETADGTLNCKLTYNRKLYLQQSVDAIMKHYSILLHSALDADRNTVVGDLDHMPPEEKRQVVFDWNNTGASFPASATIHGIFEEQVKAAGARTAVIYNNSSLTYDQLNRQANAMAWHLRRKYALRSGDLVAVLLERSALIPVTLLAILKAGGAYVPLDPSHPVQRINYILADTRCNLLISSSGLYETLKTDHIDAVIDLAVTDLTENGQVNLESVNESTDTAYLIYTSGTTGYPKGCQVSHRNVVRLLINDRLPFVFDGHDTWMMAHSYCFDFSVWEMYGALLHGGKLVIPSWPEVRDTSLFLALIRQHRVSVLNQTPAAFYELVQEECRQEVHDLHNHLRYVCFGGERLEVAYLADWIKIYPLERIALVNMYGITETTVHVTYHYLTQADFGNEQPGSVIGKPLPETMLYILDELLRPVAPGIKGEMYVGGTGVSKGYIHNKDLTVERFIPHPFEGEGMIYKTGDTGWFRHDGTIAYAGRNDTQVKIRGYRIELAEIEHALQQHTGIGKALVTAIADGKNNSLAAYYTCRAPVDVGDLREYLLGKLPEYMVPAFYHEMESFPLTANGKIDLKRLPDPVTAGVHENVYEEAGTAIEKELVQIWKQVLNRDSISITENFFEMGGHSLKAVQLIAAIHKQMDIRLELQHVFRNTTIRSLAAFIAGSAKTVYKPIAKVKDEPWYDLSHAQLRLFTLSQLEGGSAAYNIPAQIELSGPLDPDLVNNTLKALADRHESIRTQFAVIQEEPKQKIIPANEFALTADFIDLRNETDAPETAAAMYVREASKVFDLTRDALLRITLLRLDEQTFRLLFVMHHIISDGISIQILVHEFFLLYGNLISGKEPSLPELKIQYRDYTAWHNQAIAAGSSATGSFQFWKEYLAGRLPQPDLPLDGPRLGYRQYKGANELLVLDNSLSGAVNDLARQAGATLYMTVMAFLKVLLYKYTGQTDIIVGTAVSGRDHPDLSGLVGLFVNTIVVRDNVDPELAFSDFLAQVKQNILIISGHRDYPFNKLLDDLEITTEPNRHPVFDIMVNEPPAVNDYLATQQDNLKITVLKTESDTAKFDLLFSIFHHNDQIEIGLEYDTDLFHQKTIARLLGHLQNLVATAAGNPAVAVGKMNLLQEKELQDVPAIAESGTAEGGLRPLSAILRSSMEHHARQEIMVEGLRHTYQELDELCNMLTGLFRKNGVMPGDTIAAYVRDLWMSLALQAALIRYQCSCIPIPAEYQASVITAVISDGCPRALVTDIIFPFQVHCPVIQIELPSWQGNVETDVDVQEDPLLYTLYPAYIPDLRGVKTAGSDYLNYCEALRSAASVSHESVLYVNTAGIQHAGWQYVLPGLLAGSRLVLETKTGTEAMQCVNLLNENKVTHVVTDEENFYRLNGQVVFVPSLIYFVVTNLVYDNGRWASVQASRFKGVLALSGQFDQLNLYYHVFKPAVGLADSNIVRPLGNKVVTILNSDHQPQPVKLPGNIHFSSRAHEITLAGKTSCFDKGQWLPDGSIEVTAYDTSKILINGVFVPKAVIEAGITKHLECLDCYISNYEQDLTAHNTISILVVTADKTEPHILHDKLVDFLPGTLLRRVQIINMPALPLDANGIPGKFLLQEMKLGQASQLHELTTELLKLPGIDDFVLQQELAPVNTPAVNAGKILEDFWWNVSHTEPAAAAEKNGSLPASNRKAYSNGGVLQMEEEDPRTLTQALLRTAAQFPDKGLTYIDHAGNISFQSYHHLLFEARCVLNGLGRAGLKKGDSVILQIRNSREHFSVFWGCILGGIVPVTIAVPPTYRSGNAVLNKLINTSQLLQNNFVLCSGELVDEINDSLQYLSSVPAALSVTGLLGNAPCEQIYDAQPDDLVFYQLSSGSTGVPKCIQEKHRSVVWHILASRKFCNYSSADITLNWLPFDHVVPTLTFHLKDVYMGINQTEVDTGLILNEPLRWLGYIEQFKVTHSWAPNFGFKLIADELLQKQGRWDLSSVKFLMNAGEQVTFPVVKRFLESTAPFGIKLAAMQPAFGMAEVCTCMTYVNNFSYSHVLNVKKSSLKGKLQFTSHADNSTVTFVELGPPAYGHEIRIADDNNQLVDEGVIGRFQIRADSVTPGYVNNPAANQDAFVGEGWFNSGDLGFIYNGKLTLTGREKETIIIRGVNFYCYELEDEVGLIEGVLSTFVASCGIYNQANGTEELILFYSPDHEVSKRNETVISDIRAAVTLRFGITPSYIIPVDAADFYKTTSGKIQRTKMKENFEAGHFEAKVMETGQHNKKGELPQLFFEKVWRKKQAVVHRPDKNTLFLFFVSDQSSIPPGSIYDDGRSVQVSPGIEFKQISPQSFVINPAEELHYQALLEILAKRNFYPGHIIHLWNYTEPAQASCNRAHVEQSHVAGLYSIVKLVKAVAAQPANIQFTVVASGLQHVLNDDTIDLGKATLPGTVKTILQEQADIACKLVDIPFKDREHLFMCLSQEICCHDGAVETAYRNGGRYISGLKNIRIPDRFKPEIAVKRGGLYLLTGGLGGIGSKVARELLEHYSVKLLITGRTSFHPGEEDQGHAAPEVKAKWDQHESLCKGGQVVYRAVHVEDGKMMQECVAEAENIFKMPLDGIFHLAGTFDKHAAHWSKINDQLAHNKDRHAYEEMFASKVYGTIVLNDLIKHKPGALFVAFSSVNSYFGAFSYAEYAAASSFLDFFVHYQRREQQTNAMVINWSMWENVGMSRDNNMKPAVTGKGFMELNIHQAMQGFWLALGLNKTQVIAGLDPRNWNIQRFLDVEKYLKLKINLYIASKHRDAATRKMMEMKRFSGMAGSALVAVHPVDPAQLLPTGKINRELVLSQAAEGLSPSYDPPVTKNEKIIAEVLQDKLGRSSIGINDNIFDLGANSLKMVQVMSKLKLLYPGQINIGDIFDKPSVYLIALMMDERMPAAEDGAGKKVKKITI